MENYTRMNVSDYGLAEQFEHGTVTANEVERVPQTHQKLAFQFCLKAPAEKGRSASILLECSQ